MESTTKLLQECGLYVEKTNISIGKKRQLLEGRFSLGFLLMGQMTVGMHHNEEFS